MCFVGAADVLVASLCQQTKRKYFGRFKTKKHTEHMQQATQHAAKAGLQKSANQKIGLFIAILSCLVLAVNL